jgi:hypothetical protein
MNTSGQSEHDTLFQPVPASPRADAAGILHPHPTQPSRNLHAVEPRADEVVSLEHTRLSWSATNTLVNQLTRYEMVVANACAGVC